MFIQLIIHLVTFAWLKPSDGGNKPLRPPLFKSCSTKQCLSRATMEKGNCPHYAVSLKLNMEASTGFITTISCSWNLNSLGHEYEIVPLPFHFWQFSHWGLPYLLGRFSWEVPSPKAWREGGSGSGRASAELRATSVSQTLVGGGAKRFNPAKPNLDEPSLLILGFGILHISYISFCTRTETKVKL